MNCSAQRSSNIELLRILAMFLVIVLHSDFLSIGVPTVADCANNPGNAFIRFFIESLAIVAVDVFVLISGWFGIKPTLRKLVSLLFQVFFYTISILLIFILVKGFGAVHIRYVLKTFLITKCYWFVKSYLCLFILSPVLNAFVEKASKRTFEVVLICFFVFQTIYGWTDSSPDFNYGSSAISFCGLYLLARYLRLYPLRILSRQRLCILSYFILSLALAFIMWFLVRMDFHTNYAVKLSISYINPIVILASIALLFIFVNMNIPYSKTINWVAASAFSVYLIHVNIFLFRPFQNTVWMIYSNSPLALRGLLVASFLIVLFLACVLVDKIRIIIWRTIEKALFQD